MDLRPASGLQVVARWRRELADRLLNGLQAFEAEVAPLPGLTPARRESLISQIVNSSRSTWYVQHLCSIALSPDAADPRDTYWFNPVKAAIIRHGAGEDDEAFWLVFLLTHFGNHRYAGWRYVREIYGALGYGHPWTWDRVTTEVNEFRDWLDAYRARLSNPRVPLGFGNHRKYESLAGWTPSGTGAVVASYISWVGEPPIHSRRFDDAAVQAEGDPEVAFDLLYGSMRSVHRFGRLGRFDYLTMAGRIGLANIRPGRAYLRNSTGPMKGARLLFQSPSNEALAASVLEDKAVALGSYLGIGFDVLEDALCNWQKTPEVFRRFRG